MKILQYYDSKRNEYKYTVGFNQFYYRSVTEPTNTRPRISTDWPVLPCRYTANEWNNGYFSVNENNIFRTHSR